MTASSFSSSTAHTLRGLPALRSRGGGPPSKRDTAASAIDRLSSDFGLGANSSFMRNV